MGKACEEKNINNRKVFQIAEVYTQWDFERT